MKRLRCLFSGHDYKLSLLVKTDEIMGDFRVVIEKYHCSICGSYGERVASIIDREQFPGGVQQWLRAKP